MCGIACSLVPANASDCTAHLNSETCKLENLLASRGPDHSSSVDIQFSSYFLKLSGYVLWTQGRKPHEQPFVSNEKTFVFNGDAFFIHGEEIPEGTNDGKYLFDLICETDSDQDFVDLISQIKGPFAFVLVDASVKRVWFCRDYFGRSSLLLCTSSTSPVISLTSVAPSSPDSRVCEVPSNGIYCLEFNGTSPVLKCYPWSCTRARPQLEDCIGTFLAEMNDALHVSVLNLPCISPSTDCNLKPLGLLEDKAYLQLKQLSTEQLGSTDIVLKAAEVLNESVLQISELLRNSIAVRMKHIPPFCKDCLSSADTDCNHSKLNVLFSGGLDSLVLAHLVAESLPAGSSLDLTNVAFAATGNNTFNAPDRLTGLQSYTVLKKLHPKLKLNFIQVNIDKAEVEATRKNLIKDLVSPLRTVLDDSIGCCLWFASKGAGRLLTEDHSETKYTSPARVIFLGSGADELFGGYSRHRSAYENRGWEGLIAEMQEDLDRISIRNLGRDNRVVTNNGICARLPFLDEDLVDFVSSKCDIWAKCCPLFERGTGEKLLLRCVAAHLLGSENVHVTIFPKRAMQFGSRIAKLENVKEKGGDVCVRLGNS